ncbi:hypothetical protein OBBRIDRAFT_839460 [Obba rivulosa]|uniref:Uncharacterized protein n=1 Tax=Obba rivulosa TaxID=1052685 RepID=A0A8E2DJI0_9APHY|nr:hypothetical protein OBBRIDRAFT_839460 [Obba rivulosa]
MRTTLTRRTVFSAIRVYALSYGSWSLALLVLSLNMVPVGTNAYLKFAGFTYVVDPSQFSFLHSVNACAAESHISLTTDGKLYARANVDNHNTTVATITRLCVIAADAIVLVVTWCQTYTMKRRSDQYGVTAPLVKLLFRDGTTYFFVLLSLNILNFVGQLTNVFSIAAVFLTPISSIIMTHFLLDLRQVAHEPQATPDVTVRSPQTHDLEHKTSRRSSLRFTAFVSNMGESFDHGADPNDPDMVWTDIFDDEGAHGREKNAYTSIGGGIGIHREQRQLV